MSTPFKEPTEYLPVYSPDLSGLDMSDKIDQQLWVFHDSHRWVYDELVDMTRKLKARGHDKAGMKMLFEVLRWQWMSGAGLGGGPSSAPSTVTFALSNNLTSRYARLITANEPDLADMFTLKRLAKETPDPLGDEPSERASGDSLAPVSAENSEPEHVEVTPTREELDRMSSSQERVDEDPDLPWSVDLIAALDATDPPNMEV